MQFKGKCLLFKFSFVWKYFLSFFPNYECTIFLRPKKILCNLTPFLNTGFVVKSVSTCVVSTNVAGLITTYSTTYLQRATYFFIQCCDLHSSVFWIWHERFCCPLQNSKTRQHCRAQLLLLHMSIKALCPSVCVRYSHSNNQYIPKANTSRLQTKLMSQLTCSVPWYCC